MNIIILGAGRVGQSVAESLLSENNDITVIDTSTERLADLQDRMDLRGVAGSGIEVFSNAFGEYRLAGLPAGPVTLEVFHTGLATQRVVVNLPAEGAVTQDVLLREAGSREDSLVQLGRFVVQSQRETDAAAIAINEQRFAANRKDVVATDLSLQFWPWPDPG